MVVSFEGWVKLVHFYTLMKMCRLKFLYSLGNTEDRGVHVL